MYKNINIFKITTKNGNCIDIFISRIEIIYVYWKKSYPLFSAVSWQNRLIVIN